MPSKLAGSRREVLERARTLKQWATYLTTTWSVPGTVYLEPKERVTPGAWKRPRRDDEYPENSRDEWEKLRDAARAIEAYAADLAAYADAHVDIFDRQK